MDARMVFEPAPIDLVAMPTRQVLRSWTSMINELRERAEWGLFKKKILMAKPAMRAIANAWHWEPR
jgi:hypothetical protein